MKKMTWEELIDKTPFRFTYIDENKTIEIPFNMLVVGFHKGGSISVRISNKFLIVRKNRTYEQMLKIMEALR